MRRGKAKSNPFAELKAGAQVNLARAVFVPCETIATVIDAAPDAEWRLIALGRFGGLRVPSDALSLRSGRTGNKSGNTSAPTRAQGRPRAYGRLTQITCFCRVWARM